MSANPYDLEEDDDFGTWLDEQADSSRMMLDAGPSYSESDPLEPEPDSDADDAASLQAWIEQKTAQPRARVSGPVQPDYAGIQTGLSDDSRVAMAIAGLGSLATAGRKNHTPFDVNFWLNERDRADKIGAQYAAANAKAASANAKAASSDPSSDVSMRRKAALAPMLREFGVTDADLEQMSADDLASMRSGDLLRDIGTLRRQAAARSAAATAAAQTRAAEAEQYEQHRADRMSDEKAIIDYRNAGKPARAGASGGYAAPTGDTDVALVATRIPESATKEQRDAIEAQLQAARGLRGKQREKAIALAENYIRQLGADADREAAASAREEQQADAKATKEAGVLNFDDLEGSGWAYDGDPQTFQTIVNKRTLTRDILKRMADAGTAIQSLDKLIENRIKYGSNSTKWNQALTQENKLYNETAKQNYANAMGMPNTDSTQRELSHLFPDPEAVTGEGVGGVVLGLASKVGIADDPVLDALRSSRAEAVHNLQSKMAIPGLRYVGHGDGGHQSQPQPQPQPQRRADGKVRVRRNGQVGWVTGPKPTDEVL